MPISVNPVYPVIASQGAAPDLVLQPGTVIDARVLKVLEANLVRIAIAGLSIDVLSEVPLQAGAALTLAVSQTPDGIRLAIVPPQDGAAGALPASSAATSGLSQATDTSAIAPQRPVGDATSPLTPMQALAVTAAAQAAAARQSGLSPLFADAAAAADVLPAPLQQAAMQLLAARPMLTSGLDGNDIKSAFQGSGLFLESALASGSLSAGQGGVPDLKAALLVFRQTLSTWLDAAAPPPAQAAVPTPQPDPTSQAKTTPFVEALPLAPDIAVEEVYLPKALLPVAEDALGPGGAGQIVPPTAQPASAAARAAAATAALHMLQDIEGAVPSGLIGNLKTIVDGKIVADPLTAQAPMRAASQLNDAIARTDVPPPPFRGGAPAPQPVASPSIAADAAAPDTVRRLVEDTNGAIARQTLLQIASLPGRGDGAAIGIDGTVPRWNFEIPFATPQGTAVAQFEISRDGDGKAVGSVSKVWRARFTLNIEPAGPVHALVSLSGETTSVRMWAERPLTALQLRENAPQLSRALRQAELEPGDIVIGAGAPPQPAATPPAGHFLDRAT
jgi:hypothetical protein